MQLRFSGGRSPPVPPPCQTVRFRLLLHQVKRFQPNTEPHPLTILRQMWGLGDRARLLHRPPTHQLGRNLHIRGLVLARARERLIAPLLNKVYTVQPRSQWSNRYTLAPRTPSCRPQPRLHNNHFGVGLPAFQTRMVNPAYNQRTIQRQRIQSRKTK